MQQRNAMGARIRELRQEQGCTLAELAEHVGVSTSYLSRLERGATAPSFSIGAALARELGVTAQELATTNRVQGEVNTQLIAVLVDAGLDEAVACGIQQSISTAARQELLRALTADTSILS